MEKNKKIKWLYYVIIVAVAIIMCIPLFQKGINTGHDGEFHMSRVIGAIEELKQKNSPFVVSRFSNGLGFGWNLFYPPISTLIPLIFTVITNNIVLAMKLFIFCTFVFSGITMFQLIETISKNKLAALLVSILYMIAPYRLLNVYTRLAVGEMVSFIFIPIIFRGVYLIFEGKTDKAYLFVFGTIALLLSHNISTLLTFILGVFYVLINLNKLKDKKILKTLVISTFIIILSVVFFEVPLLEQKQATDYEVFRYGKMYSKLSVGWHALNPLQLLVRNAPGADSSMYFCIGIPTLLALLLTPFTIKKLNHEQKKDYIFILVAGIISVIMSTFLFPWFAMPSILLMIQFPWRMLVLITFCFSIIAGINLAVILKCALEKKDKYKGLIWTALVVIIVLSCLYSLSFVKDLDVRNINNDYFREPEVIDTTMETSRYSSFIEYWPEKAEKSIHYIVEHDGKVHILSGNANITEENKENGILTFTINDVEENTKLELPYICYKGYRVEYKKADSDEKIILEPTESEHGLIQVELNSDYNGSFEVSYHATKLHKICIIISFSTISIYILYLIVSCIKNRKKRS